MLDENEEIHEEEELSKEEQPHTQRFSVVIMWSPEIGERIGPGDLQSVIHDALEDLDENATVEVTEIAEPTY